MTKHAFQQSVFSGSDTVAVAPFAQITVTNSSDSSAASIWEDADGATEIAGGQFLADQYGYFIFYADPGIYDIAIASDALTKTLRNVEVGRGGGVFSGYWDMSSGTSGPASPIYDFNTTHTSTTITPDAHITSVSPRKLAVAASEQIQIPVSGAASASITVPTDGPDDTIYAVVLYLANYDATPQQLENLMNGNQPPGVFALYVAIAPWGGVVALGAYNDGVSPSESGASVSAGDVVTLTIDYATGEASIAVNGGSPVGPVTLDLAGITSAQGLQLVAGVISNSEYVTFADGHVTVDFSGFASYVNATLPDGAEDGDWYEVSAGGYFHGKTTRTGQFVKLIRDKSDLIVVDNPADTGTTALEAKTVTHFSDINTTGLAEPRLYVVTDDETNANQRTQYLYDGTTLMWLVAVEA